MSKNGTFRNRLLTIKCESKINRRSLVHYDAIIALLSAKLKFLLGLKYNYINISIKEYLQIFGCRHNFFEFVVLNK